MRVSGVVKTLILGLIAGAVGTLSIVKLRDDRYVEGIWSALEASPTGDGTFTERMVAGLPDPARRYFRHAIQQGTPLAGRFRWHYTGEMKPGAKLPWMSLEADQILVKRRGFVWKATARKRPLVVTVRDHYLDGAGRMRVALFGLVTVVNATGADLSKSALARLIIEGVALPSALLPGPDIQITGIDSSRFTVTTHLHGETTPITLTVDPDGRLNEVTMQRWGNLTADDTYQFIPYGMQIAEERTLGGYTIPSQFTGGWWYGTEKYNESVRLTVDWARLD
jgi:hypothetical protein